VEQPGELAWRGGILDVYPFAGDFPIRIEFFGDEIESIRSFSASTQRTSKPVEEARIVPAQELLPSTADDWLSPLSKLGLKKMPAEARERIEEDLTLLKEGASFKERDFYVQFLAPSTLLDHLPEGALLIVDEEADVQTAIEEAEAQGEATRKELEAAGEIPYGLPQALETWPQIRRQIEATGRVLTLARWAMPEDGQPGAEDGDAIRLPFAASGAFAGQLRKLATEVAQGVQSGQRFVIVSQQAERLAELLEEQDAHATVGDDLTDPPPRLSLVRGSLHDGWKLSPDGPPSGAEAALTLLTDSEVFGFVKQRRAPPKKAVNREAFLADLTQGAYVVHIDHGIGRFDGLETLGLNDVEHDCVRLIYDGGDKLYVPVEDIEVLSRYGDADTAVALDRLGGAGWQARNARLKQRIKEMAGELMRVAAERRLRQGARLTPPSGLYEEFCARFAFEETDDQQRAIDDVMADLASGRPMDRLICGDVGFGKTEIAFRAAFVTVMAGKQVAVVVPTTLLARQHYETFSERFAGWPVRIGRLSRLVPAKEVAETKQGLADGTVDIVIGTHALLAKDIRFRDLGLLVVDEEHRFGVAHKERLKQLRKLIDVLTLSATPIPRTLQLALTGVRDLSLIATPPVDRLAVRTFIAPFDAMSVREALLRERLRGGQAFYVVPRIADLPEIKQFLDDHIPEARVGIAHGRMAAGELDQVMTAFYEGRYDVLLSTTIIESGLDIPTANTLIVHRSDMFGLAQLYQLRGRVGRSHQHAYAYFIVPSRQNLSEEARRRLRALQEFSELGAGFRLAAADLEIRGAGELLGSRQHGHIAALGFDMYCQMLERAVQEIRGDAPPERKPVNLHLGIDIKITGKFLPDAADRLVVYKRLASTSTCEDVDRLQAEMEDRYGHFPPNVRNLFDMGRLRLIAEQIGVQSVDIVEDRLVVRFHEEPPIDPQRILDLVEQQHGSLSPSGRLTLPAPPKGPGRVKAVGTLLQRLAAEAA